MPNLTPREQQEIDRTNASGLAPVVFVHGLWLLASGWDQWRALFEENGYTTLAPGWPDDPETVAEANRHPAVFANKKVKQVTDHYADAIRQLKTQPPSSGILSAGSLPSGWPARDWPPSPSRSIRPHSAACCRCRSRR
jgi:non-heme chloroperoxidase